MSMKIPSSGYPNFGCTIGLMGDRSQQRDPIRAGKNFVELSRKLEEQNR